MSGPSAIPVFLTETQRTILEHLVRCSTSPQRIVMRAKIILAAAKRQNNQQIATTQNLVRDSVMKWRKRWTAASDSLIAIEAEDDEDQDKDKKLRAKIEELLSDAPRPGAPATFTAEAIVKIVAVACEEPQASGRPVTNWTPKELADEVIKRQIVASISPRSAGRFLKAKQTSSPTSADTG